MPEERIVLVATDLADAGAQAIEAGDAWCRAHGSNMVVVHVVRENGPPDAEKQARERGDAQMRAVGREPTKYPIRVVAGRAADRLLELAEELNAELLVLGGREPGEKQWIFGSVADRVVAHAKIPVLVARGHKGSGRIVAGTDFSVPSLPAVRAAHQAARATHARVTIVHVVERSTEHYSAVSTLTNVEHGDEKEIAEAREKLHALCESSPERDDARVVVGNPADKLLAVAEEIDASLVVVASRSRGALARFVLGSVAGRVVKDANCSVLVVPLRA